MLANDTETHSVPSNKASNTAVNSVASPLREKMVAFHQMKEKKRREIKNYKFKILGAIFFSMIISMMIYYYFAYQQPRSSFAKIEFNAKDRILHVLNKDNKTITAGLLGKALDQYNDPINCLDDKDQNDESICIEWSNNSRLSLNSEIFDEFRCYTIHWQPLSKNVYPIDCYELTLDKGFWFGGGITKDMDWTLSGDVKVHQMEYGMKRYFINSIGVVIQVDNQAPLKISVNRTSNEFCLQAINDEKTFINHFINYPELNYKICTSEDMSRLNTLITPTSLWDGLKESDKMTLNTLLEEPIWKVPFKNEIDSINETIIFEYLEEIISMDFMRQGHILVNEFWQRNIGDFTVDQARFPKLKDIIDVLHRRGFKIIFTIQPFISNESPNFDELSAKKLFIYEFHKNHSTIALTRLKGTTKAGVLDITNNASIPWLLEKLYALKNEYHIDGFYLDMGMLFNLPSYYEFHIELDNPDMYAQTITSILKEVGLIGASTANVAPSPPTFLSMSSTMSSWKSLREIVSTVINYSIIGYPFVLPGAVGGESEVDGMQSTPELPDQELYLRWLQLVIFMPTMQFSHLPTEFKNDSFTEIVKDLMTIRQNIVTPLLKRHLNDAMNKGLPLVRPLWMLDLSDLVCLGVGDEFSVGEELIVAPILEENTQERDVYLPQGVWKDGIDGSLHKGSRWLHNYKVPLDKVAYFVKITDDTTF